MLLLYMVSILHVIYCITLMSHMEVTGLISDIEQELIRTKHVYKRPNIFNISLILLGLGPMGELSFLCDA